MIFTFLPVAIGGEGHGKEMDFIFVDHIFILFEYLHYDRAHIHAAGSYGIHLGQAKATPFAMS
jgi:hypothetical protein